MGREIVSFLHCLNGGSSIISQMCIQNAICFPFKRISNNCSARSLISQKPSQKKDYKAHVGIASQACLTADFIVGGSNKQSTQENCNYKLYRFGRHIPQALAVVYCRVGIPQSLRKEEDLDKPWDHDHLAQKSLGHDRQMRWL